MEFLHSFQESCHKINYQYKEKKSHSITYVIFMSNMQSLDLIMRTNFIISQLKDVL